MTRRCHSPDAFESAPEPEADDEEAYVGYDDGEIQGLPYEDEIEPTADSEDDGWDGDISEDEMGDGPIADEDFFGDDEMEDNPTDEEGVLDNGVEGEEDGEMEVDSDSESDNDSDNGVEGEEDGEMEVDSDSDSDSESDSESDSDSDDETEDGSTGVEEEEVDSAWGSVSDAEGDDGDDGDENDGDDDEGCVDNGDDDSDDQIVRPVRHLRNVVGSDDDGEVTARAAHPPGTMAVFDELAPADIDNPCEFQIKTL